MPIERTMLSLADRPELIGFFSYAREDDEGSAGALSKLRERIQHELRAQLGRSSKSFRLWQDREAIPPGSLWEKEITAAVSQSVFFVPIVTPTAVKSPHCKIELDLFLARQSELERNNLVFPIVYISVPALEDERVWRTDPVLSMIHARQFVSWDSLRHEDFESRVVKRSIAKFCKNIADTLSRPDPLETERERRRLREIEEQAEQAEAERRRAEQRRLRDMEEEERRQREKDRNDRKSGGGPNETAVVNPEDGSVGQAGTANAGRSAPDQPWAKRHDPQAAARATAARQADASGAQDEVAYLTSWLRERARDWETSGRLTSRLLWNLDAKTVHGAAAQPNQGYTRAREKLKKLVSQHQISLDVEIGQYYSNSINNQRIIGAIGFVLLLVPWPLWGWVLLEWGNSTAFWPAGPLFLASFVIPFGGAFLFLNFYRRWINRKEPQAGRK
jgi:hypothetical protein